MAVSQETVSTISQLRIHDSYTNAVVPLADEDFDDEDDFEDAQPTFQMDLQTAFEECQIAMQKFFNNDIETAMYMMKSWGKTSLYHSLGVSIFEFIPAILTFDHGQINNALAALKVCISICNEHRRNYNLVESIGTMIKKPNYSNYTDLEAHAELCYAEALLLQAAMTIMEGEDLTGLIKATIKVKNCYSSYKYCSKILEKKKWDNERSRIEFQSGVRLGTASFSLMVSLLPPKIISLLEFVGFSGNKEFGLEELKAGSRAPGLRSVLCDLTLLAYNLVISHFIGAQGDLQMSEEILEKEMKVYPDGVWFLLFKARLEMMKGRLEPAIVTYHRAANSQKVWKQFHHVCYWEVMWIDALLMEWRDAAEYADKLIAESSWSRTIYSYTRASLLLQVDDLNTDEHQHCVDLLRNASYYKQRIAGKSLPMEKFMIKRCARFQAQGNNLVLPAIELLCLWNMFHILSKNERAIQNILEVIERARERVEKSEKSWMCSYEADNKALVRYLHGCCLAAMSLPRLALDALQSVMLLKSDIKEDTFLVPYTVAEMAMCHYQLGDSERAIQMLQEARKKYSGYSLESRLHFRLHSRMEMVKNKKQEEYSR